MVLLPARSCCCSARPASYAAFALQKYREFTEEFSDVGLLTGDITINPSATCLVSQQKRWHGSSALCGRAGHERVHRSREAVANYAR